MLVFLIQEFLTVFPIGLGLAPFWGAFGISGGIWTPPTPPPLGTPLLCRNGYLNVLKEHSAFIFSVTESCLGENWSNRQDGIEEV